MNKAGSQQLVSIFKYRMSTGNETVVKRLSVQFKDVHPNILQNPRHQRPETSQEWRTGRPESLEYNGQVARSKIPEKSGWSLLNQPFHRHALPKDSE